MDTLHTVLRSIRENKSAHRGHLSVFREFISHLDRIGRRAQMRAPAKRKVTTRRKAK